ncbi:hypothetical protein OZ411_01340 [Bradyrhizobium sp. Arg237L]|uniref:phage tail fiber protein n=1 Tax=Bradyrhizobium sp. Arg237L TaxID=3003352 RepID=UPI00249DB525|nr:hypothetical protein [Bradyrhizobium sp. Arg237L]MDI4231457.1 hypothetical protein [Bradyrhizobium sp. Arg237L]
MDKSDTFRNDMLKLIFHGTPIPNIADNAASSPLTQYFLALHTADPASGGNQSTSECAYAGYARVAIERDGTGWVIGGNVVSPADDVTFPLAASGGEIALFATIGVASSGAGKVLYRGALNPPVVIATGVPPVIVQGSTITET